MAVKLHQNVALHLQLHLRVLLEDLRVTLAQHLRHPFVRYSSCTQPGGISGSKVVDSEVGDLCPPSVLDQTFLKVVWCPFLFRSLGNKKGLCAAIAICRRKGFDDRPLADIDDRAILKFGEAGYK